MSPMLQLLIAAAIGAAVLAAARASHARHLAKFGVAPHGSYVRTSLWFLATSIVLAALAWWSWVFLAVGMAVLAVVGTVFGFRTRAWGGWQAFRDGALFACFVVVPVAAVFHAVAG